MTRTQQSPRPQSIEYNHRMTWYTLFLAESLNRWRSKSTVWTWNGCLIIKNLEAYQKKLLRKIYHKISILKSIRIQCEGMLLICYNNSIVRSENLIINSSKVFVTDVMCLVSDQFESSSSDSSVLILETSNCSVATNLMETDWPVAIRLFGYFFYGLKKN